MAPAAARRPRRPAPEPACATCASALPCSMAPAPGWRHRPGRAKGSRCACACRSGLRPVSEALRVVVAEDEPLALDRLLRALADLPAVEIVGSAGDGLEAARQIEALKPDLAILDIQMPGR